MADIRFNTLSMDTGAVMDAVKRYYIVALDDAVDRFIDIMVEEMNRTNYGDGPGKPDWRKDVSSLIEELNRIVAEEKVEIDVGLKEGYNDVDFASYVKAMLIAYGGGSEGLTKKPIKTKPGGIVWDDDMSELVDSKAKSEWDLPEKFNQPGNKFIDNAVKRMKKIYSSILDYAGKYIPSSIFYDNVFSR